MEHRWNLNPLYESFDSKAFKGDIEKIKTMIGEFDKWSSGLGAQKDEVSVVEKYIDMENSLGDIVSRAFSYCSLTLAVESKNETAQMNMDRLQKIMVAVRLPRVRFQRWLSERDPAKMAAKSDKIKEHRFILEEIARDGKYLLHDEVERAIAKLSTTGGRAWSMMQGLISANLMVEYTDKGKKTSAPLTVVRNLAHSPSGEVRKNAFEGELKAYEKIEDASAAALNAIKGEAITMAEMRGYKSPLEMTLINSRMTKKSLDAMMGAVKEYLPVFREYMKKKAELLGYSGGLKFYDVFAPVGKSDKEYSFEDAHKLVVENFADFSAVLSDFADNAFKNQWIDAEPREGKRGGAFCSNLHPIGESRIMANFSGSIKNVITLAHELGHGYHGHCLKDATLLNAGYPMPLAETASIFCETVVKNALLSQLEGEAKTAFLESAVCGYSQIIVDIYSRYLFETELFETRGDRTIPAKELKAMMLKAQKEAYGDGLDPDVLHPYMWANKPHYYMTGRHFYNFPYTFGLLFAKGLYAEYLKDKDGFVGKYDQLLELTGKADIKETAAFMGIDVEDKRFWRQSLELIKDEVKSFIKQA